MVAFLCVVTRIAESEREGTRAETRIGLSVKLTSPFKSAGGSVQSTTGSRGVRISRQDYWLPTSFASFPFTSPTRASPCAVSFRFSSTTRSYSCCTTVQLAAGNFKSPPDTDAYTVKLNHTIIWLCYHLPLHISCLYPVNCLALSPWDWVTIMFFMRWSCLGAWVIVTLIEVHSTISNTGSIKSYSLHW